MELKTMQISIRICGSVVAASQEIYKFDENGQKKYDCRS